MVLKKRTVFGFDIGLHLWLCLWKHPDLSISYFLLKLILLLTDCLSVKFQLKLSSSFCVEIILSPYWSFLHFLDLYIVHESSNLVSIQGIQHFKSWTALTNSREVI